MTRCKMLVYVPTIEGRKSSARWNRADEITSQFRYLVRLAVACAEHGTDYDVRWDVAKDRTTATIEACGAIPPAKKLSAPPREKAVAPWKPSILEAEYRLEAYFDNTLKRMAPGFVVAHSSGLALVKASESGEMGVTANGGDDGDIRAGWMLIHLASGRGFGLTLNFARAVQALLMAASFPVDWTLGVDDLHGAVNFQRAGNEVVAKFGNAHQKQQARWKLERLAA